MKWRYLLFSGLVFGLLFYFNTTTKASDWEQNANYSIEAVAKNPDSHDRLNCDIKPYDITAINLSYPMPVKEDGTPDYLKAMTKVEGSSSACFANSKYGEVQYGGDRISGKSGRVLRFITDYGAVSLQQGDAGVSVYYSASPTGYSAKNISLNYSLLYISELSASGNELVLKPRTEALSPFLRNSDGSLTDFLGWTSSSNGKFMVLQLFDGTVVRLNTNTQEMTPVTRRGADWGSTTSYSISNDGRYVFAGDLGFEIFDLENCSAKYPKDSWPKIMPDYSPEARVFPGCSTTGNQNITAVRSSIESAGATSFGPYAGVIESRFDYDDKQIKYIVNTNSNTNPSRDYLVTLKSPNYRPLDGYLAMGDSFSSGEGDNDGNRYYELPTDLHALIDGDFENLCHLSSRSYSYLIKSMLQIEQDKFHSVACSGAQISNVVGGKTNSVSMKGDQYRFFANPWLGVWTPGFGNQIEYLTGMNNGNAIRQSLYPEVLTISIGGNDINMIGNLKQCLGPWTCGLADRDEPELQSIWAAEIASLEPRLKSTYQRIRQASPDTRVYVVGYPLLLSNTTDLTSCANNAGDLSFEEIELIRKTQIYLNDIVEAAAKEAGVYYVDVENILEGRNLCSGAPDKNMAVNGVTFGDDIDIKKYGIGISAIFGNESFHPNENAQQLYSDRILSQTNNLTHPMPTATPIAIPAPDSFFGQEAINIVNLMNQNKAQGLRIREYSNTMIQSNGEMKNIYYSQDGYAPNSFVTIGRFSEYRELATVQANNDGVVSGVLQIPSDSEPGQHELHMYGTSPLGEPLDYYDTFILAGPDANDVDADGISNDQDKCTFVPQANTDEDQDGIDDGCDGYIAEAPKDETAPIVAGTATTHPNESGWYNHEVLVNWAASDPEYSSGAPTTPPQTVADIEGENTYTSEQSCDPAGNCATGSISLKIDTSLPTISYSLSNAPNSLGWNNGPVTVNFACSDAVSGVNYCPEPQTITENGVHIITVKTVDLAGNEAQANIAVKVDSASPSIIASYSKSPNASGVYSEAVTVSFSCSDELSGVATCPSPVTYSQSGTYNLSVQATDSAGNVQALTKTIKVEIASKATCTLGTILAGKCKALDTPTCKAHFKNYSLIKFLTIPKGCLNELKGINWLLDIILGYIK